MKCCTKCQLEQPEGSFYRDARSGGRRAMCKACSLEQSNEWRARHHDKAKEIQRRSALRRRLLSHGLELAQFEAMVENTQGRCEICGRAPTGAKRELSIDHDHQTGRVRGLLCDSCNMAIGLLSDDPDRAIQVAAYLRR